VNETELASIVQRRVEDSLGTFGDQLSADRVKGLKYYRGEPFGDEVDGRSRVVSRDVAEAVDSLMPPLLKVFLSGDKVVMFEPVGQEDIPAAEQATDYINHVFLQQNDGFRLVYTTLKDGLLFKTGVGKVWWDDTPEQVTERYMGLTDEQVMLLQQDPDLEIEIEENEEYEPGMEIDVRVTKTNARGKCCVAPIPPEEFLIDQYATMLDQSTPDGPLFTGHRQMRIVSDVVEQFPDKKEIIEASAGIGGDADHSGERRERFALDSPGEMPDHDETDISTRPVWVVEAYVRVDYDGDGVAELRKVTCVGETGYQVIDNEEVDDNPFAAWSPVMMPHKFHGMSVAEQIFDVQRIKSTVQRGMLNNLYFCNEPMTKVRRGRVDLDALLNRRVGGVVEMEDTSDVEEMVVPPMFQHAFPMLEYLDTVREQRTGVTRYSQGLDAESLNKTARGMMIIQDASQQRQELIARVYAEMFMKRLFGLILKCVSRYQESPRMIRLRGEWVPMDPRTWKNKYDMTVTVGLGTGNRDQQAAHAMNMLNIQKELVAGGKTNMVTDSNIYKTVEKYVEAVGLKSAEPYFTDPGENQQPQQPPVDPKVVEIQGKQQLQSQKEQMDHQFRMMQLDRDHEVNLYKAKLDAMVKGWSAEQDADRDLAKAIDEIEIKRVSTDADIGMKADSTEAGMEIQKRKADTDDELVRKKSATETGLARKKAHHDRSLERAAAGLEPEEEPEPEEDREFRNQLPEIVEGLTEAVRQTATILDTVSRRLDDVEKTITAPKSIDVQYRNGKPTGAKVTQNGKTSTITLQ
jgi:hypothetical protein